MPLTLKQQAQLVKSEDYRDRVQYAYLKVAKDVLAEPSNTANHETRVKLAEQVLNGSGIPPRAPMLLHILNEALQVPDPTDSDIIYTVNQQWDYFANQAFPAA